MNALKFGQDLLLWIQCQVVWKAQLKQPMPATENGASVSFTATDNDDKQDGNTSNSSAYATVENNS